MFKTTKPRVIGLVLVGVVVLAGAVYATTAWAASGASASATSSQVAQAASESQLRAAILDMLQDRMGLTGSDAEKFANQMIARMQNAGSSLDFEAMIDWCIRFIDDDSGDSGSWGMMNRSQNPGYGPCGLNGAYPGSSDSQDSGSDSTPRGMMGTRGGMMGIPSLR